MAWKAYLKWQAVRGQQIIPFDMWRMLHWDLYTHGGYYTYPHHDANGTCTYMIVRSGCKIWGLIRPTVPASDTNRTKLFKTFRRMVTTPGETQYRKHSQLATVFLKEGDVLYVF